MDKIDTSIIRANMRRFRENAGMKQRDVAEKMDVTIATVSKWEANPGSVKMLHMAQMAQLYGCNIRDFFVGCDLPIRQNG